MYEDHTVGVVIPAYDEAEFIGEVICDIPDYVDRLYVIDDDSNDGTWDAIQAAAETRAESIDGQPQPPGAGRDGSPAGSGEQTPVVSSATARRQPPQTDRHKSHDPVDRTDRTDAPVQSDEVASRVSVSETIGCLTRIQHEENRGAGGAIKTGYLVAIEDGVDIVATIDGDGQMESSTLSRMLDPLVAGNADYAKGNRFYNTDVMRNMPLFRLIGNLLLTGLTRISTGYWRLLDPQNGFTAVTRETLVDAEIESLWTYYGYMNQLMVRFNSNGVRIADVPMKTIYGDEESNINYRQYIRKLSLLLLRTFLARLKNAEGVVARSIAACYLLGAVGIFATVITIHRQNDMNRGPVSLSVALLVAGVVIDGLSKPNVIRWEDT